jgi:hypothetical protein
MFGKFPLSTSNTAADNEFIESLKNAGESGIKLSNLKAILERKKLANLEPSLKATLLMLWIII